MNKQVENDFGEEGWIAHKVHIVLYFLLTTTAVLSHKLNIRMDDAHYAF